MAAQCPNCNAVGTYGVFDSRTPLADCKTSKGRQIPGALVHRRRKCTSCGHKGNTVEISADDMAKESDIRISINCLKTALERLEKYR